MTRSRLYATMLAAVIIAVAAVAPRAAVNAQPAPFDQQFIDMMVPHHEGALEMARIAEARAEHPEIKSMAADVLRTQADEIAQLKAWRLAWFGSDQTPPMGQMPMVDGVTMEVPMGGAHAVHGGMPPMGSAAPDGQMGPAEPMTMDMAADIEQLRNAPEPFDLAFIDAMTLHHGDAIAAARVAQARAERPEIRDMVLAIVRDQEREVILLQQWRRDWYGR